MLCSPFEQFQIIPLIHLNLFNLDFSLTNIFLINFLILLCFLSLVYGNTCIKTYFKEIYCYLKPNSWQKSVEFIFDVISELAFSILARNSEKYFPLILVLFNFILFSNLIGLIPYSFTVTSHLIVTFTLSFSVFICVIILTFKKHSMESFSLFLPTNTTFFLALFLVPIEFISYIARPISLGVRLFVNLMAGHILLKVIAGFSWSLLLLENFVSFALIVPLLILVLLFGLELGVALIQTYVFIVLTCVYIQDGS